MPIRMAVVPICRRAAWSDTSHKWYRGDIGVHWRVSHESFARVLEFRSLETRGKTVAKRVGTEIAPEIPAASHHAAIPVQYGSFSKLMADGSGVIGPASPVEIVASRGESGLDLHQVGVADRRDAVVP
jgi:hypothetical protein